jgi:hypothetical protein
MATIKCEVSLRSDADAPWAALSGFGVTGKSSASCSPRRQVRSPLVWAAVLGAPSRKHEGSAFSAVSG